MDPLGNWVTIKTHPFHLDLNHVDNLIRLRAHGSIESKLYKVTIRGEYHISATETRTRDYIMPIYGDPCYTALDNMDELTRFELFDPATF